MTVIENRTLDFDVDLRLVPTRPTRHEFHRQIARLEHELSTALAGLDPSRRPQATASRTAQPHVLNDAELEATRDALVARLGEAEELVTRQKADHEAARALLKRMDEAPAHFRWTKVTTKDMGVEGCRTWQSVPVLGPIGMLGNWWRIRMSSGCP
jgi:hypothetical protein